MPRVIGFENEPDGLYEKYRVFREPEFDDARNPVGEHPVLMTATFDTRIEGSEGFVMTSEASEVEGFVFVLKPDTDPHARVAISAYAWSVMDSKPELARDLLTVLGEWVSD